ncbi:MAG TPA: nucleotidyltransferase domain-containing protein [Bacteroidales bacterium]|jgi:predicted nucleotidyltransferase|nr:nucleotidyltransferase domain-containing protein [Bacteroidales bacterium]
MGIIDNNLDKIKILCEKYKVARLFVFGSVLTELFDKSSDIDCLVDFKDVNVDEYADYYFGFKKAMENLLKREVDLVEDKAIRNPYLRESVDNSKRLIYG